MPTYEIREATADSKVGYQPYGAAVEFWKYKGSEVIIAGPAETGKTRAALEKFNALCWKYAGSQNALIRKVKSDMHGSCIQTYEDKVLGYKPQVRGTPIVKYGGEHVEFYDYPNKSRIWVGGLDNPGKILSSERDFVLVNQAEQLDLDEWETITTRTTGRAGHAPYAQVMGDVNPGAPSHWIRHRESLRLLHSRHEDNPVLYDRNGQLTAQGRRTMAVLDNLTGTRKERLRYGRWVQAEGVVYPQFDEAIHLIPRFDIPVDWRRIRVIDFGLKNPFVCAWWAIDNDDRLYRYREIYMTGRTVTTHARQINELSQYESIYETICDHDAEDRQTLAENGIPNIPAKKDVASGVGFVQDRLAHKNLEGKPDPRILYLRDSLIEIDQSLAEQRKPTKTEDEFGGYIWKDKVLKEQPVQEDNHGMDMSRYTAAYLDAKPQWVSMEFLSI